MAEEDRAALAVLNDPAHISAVLEISKKIAFYLDTQVEEMHRDSFIQNLNSIVDGFKGSFPVLPQTFSSFKELCSFLNTETDHIKLLCIIWQLFPGVNHKFVPKKMRPILEKADKLYEDFIAPTKDHIVYEKKKKIIYNNVFGNSKTIQSTLFNIFVPYVRDVDYVEMKENSSNAVVKRCKNRGIPMITGASGMTNMTCKVLGILRLHPFHNGRKFCEAMAAFIVGSGMHSYYEVNKSFNLWAQIVN